MSIDPGGLRLCVGHFATGVTVVSCATSDPPGAHGTTVSSFTSVSLDPPLVLVSLDRRTRAAGMLSATAFTINVLGADQLDLALRFSGRPAPEPTWEQAEHGPRLAGCPAYVCCRPWATYDGGDHLLFLGLVVEVVMRAGADREQPLVFYRGGFRLLGAPHESLLLAPGHAGDAGWFGDLPEFARHLSKVPSRKDPP